MGLALVYFSQSLLPWKLAFASGAMLFVFAGEMALESHKKGFSLEATFGLVAGFIIMRVAA
ncbi:MAG: hypothetical protein JTT11_10035 [Candidatus Brockarchaeota archaeon]|nr:hypothetical protein [Candidatus Brockarchaeota archaeon]